MKIGEKEIYRCEECPASLLIKVDHGHITKCGFLPSRESSCMPLDCPILDIATNLIFAATSVNMRGECLMINQELMAFWEYDMYPYVKYGTVESFSEYGHVHPKEYPGYGFNPILILPLEKGKELAGHLEMLQENYERQLKNLKESYEEDLYNIMPVMKSVRKGVKK